MSNNLIQAKRYCERNFPRACLAQEYINIVHISSHETVPSFPVYFMTDSTYIH